MTVKPWEFMYPHLPLRVLESLLLKKDGRMTILFVEKTIRISNDFFRDLAKIGAFLEEFPTILGK